LGRLTDFRARMQRFIEQAQTYRRQDHEPAGQALLNEVASLEAADYLTGPEALALRLSVLRYILPPNAYQEQADALLGEAREEAARVECALAEQPDPRLERYHAAQRVLIEEVNAMSDVPGGIDRQTYLQREMAALRSTIFAGGR
jgi:hypothetical protein